MNPNPNTSHVSQEINRLIQTRFVFHSWQNLPILGPDGALFHLDTRMLDVDNETSFKDNDGIARTAGLGYLKRLRLLPITTTQKPVINNKIGFAVSNVFLGSIGSDGQPEGIGSNMSGAMKTNVKGEYVYPDEKVGDMVYTFGKYGLVAIRSLTASDQDSINRCQQIFNIVMSGLSDKTLLEDMPEYFGEQSPYILDKRPYPFKFTAMDAVEKALQAGTLFPGDERAANALVEEIKGSIMGAHSAALDSEAAGILAQTREGIQTGQKRGYDKCDQWLMGQFPSFPMDTELEKSQKQLMRALDNTGPEPSLMDPPDVEELRSALAEQTRRNDALEERLNKVEMSATATPAPTPTPAPAAPSTPAQ
jgi:hypothetical protein